MISCLTWASSSGGDVAVAVVVAGSAGGEGGLVCGADWVVAGAVGGVVEGAVEGVVAGVVEPTSLDGEAIVAVGDAPSSPEHAVADTANAPATSRRRPIIGATRSEQMTSRPFTMPGLGSGVHSGDSR